MRHTALLMTVLAVALVGGRCSKPTRGTKPTTETEPAAGTSPVVAYSPALRAQLDQAPERVRLAEREFGLSVNLWRDFMPPVPPGGNPLRVRVSVAADGAPPFPSAVKVEQVWVLSGEEHWSPPLPPAPNSTAGATNLEYNMGDGPKWEPGRKADVVVRLALGKQTALLRAAGLTIQRTD
jgi:hypothetical protein